MLEKMDIHNESLVEKFIKRGAWLYLFSFLIGPLGYGIKIAISYNLSVSEVGLLYGILSFIGLISSFNDLGMIESLNYFIPKLLAKNEYEKAKSFIVYAGVVMLATSLALMSGLHFSAPWLATHYFHVPEATGIIQIFAVFLFLTNVLHFNVTIFSIYQNTKHQKWTEFFRLIVTLGFALWLTLHSTGNISAYAWAWNYGVFAATIMSLWNVWRLHLGSLHRDYSMRMNRAHIKELLEYSLWSLLALNIGIVLSQLDMQLLVFLKGTEDAGYYSNYLSLIGIPFVFTSPLVGFIFPVVSAYAGKGDTEKLTRIKTAFTRIFTVIGFVGMLMFFLYGQSLGAFLFGEKFRISGEILMYSTPFLIFNFLLQINFQILGGTGRVKERLKIMLVGLIVNLIMNLTLIPAF